MFTPVFLCCFPPPGWPATASVRFGVSSPTTWCFPESKIKNVRPYFDVTCFRDRWTLHSRLFVSMKVFSSPKASTKFSVLAFTLSLPLSWHAAVPFMLPFSPFRQITNSPRLVGEATVTICCHTVLRSRFFRPRQAPIEAVT